MANIRGSAIIFTLKLSAYSHVNAAAVYCAHFSASGCAGSGDNIGLAPPSGPV